METTLIPKIISFPVAFGVSILFTLSIIDIAEKRKLFDANNRLKCHLEKVCSLGGIAIFTAFWIAALLITGFQGGVGVNYLFVGSFILFLTGVRDDLVGIPALKRLFIQIGVASLMFVGGIRLEYLPGLHIELPVWGSYLLTIGLTGAVVNAYNFIDGINGLAGGLAMISSFSFAMMYFTSGLENYGAIALALAGAIGGFFIFNFGKAKIFMGDNGSTFIGIMLSFFTIIFFQHHQLNGGPIAWQPALVPAILLVPLTDMVKVVAGRVLRGLSPFKGDHTHIHHLMLKAGWQQKGICVALYFWSVLAVLFSMLVLPQNIWAGILLLVVVAAVPYGVLTASSSSHPADKAGPSGLEGARPSELF